MTRADDFVAVLARLNMAVVHGRKAPYKPLLLLTVLWQFDRDGQVDEYLVLDGSLVDAVQQVARVVLRTRDGPALRRTTVAQPYRHLANDFKGTGLWDLVAAPGQSGLLDAARNCPHRLKDLMHLTQAVRIDPTFLAEVAASAFLRRSLMRTILTTHADVFDTDAVARWEDFLQTAPRNPAPLPVVRLSERVVEASFVQGWAATPWAADGVKLDHSLKPFQQHRTGDGGRIDLLGFQPVRREWWVIELKVGRAVDTVVGQTLRYVGWLDTLPVARSDRVVGAVVAQEVDDRLKHAVRAAGRLSLWRYDDELQVSRVLL